MDIGLIRRGFAGVVVVALSMCGGTTIAGATMPQSAAPSTADTHALLRIDFEHARIGKVMGATIANEGSAAARVTLAAVNNSVTSIGANAIGNRYLRLPRYAGIQGGSYAALKVESTTDDWLSPGADDFIFGADIRLDAVSSGNRVDNGNNIMQRGLYADSAQYKLQVDNNHASCLLRGDKGEAFVKSAVVIEPKKWYNVRCERLGKVVRLSVITLDSDQTADVSTTIAAVGEIVVNKRVPLAVGAKLMANGQLITSSTDQFNGRLDNIFYS